MTDIDGAVARAASRGPVALGPVDVGGRTLLVRPPVLDDHARWRSTRLRDQALIEPFWVRGAQSWEARHRRNEWVREVVAARRGAASGRALPCVIEVDGDLAGQCGLTAIDPDSATAELGVWLDSRLGRTSIATVAVGMLVDHAFAHLGIRRVVAPAAADNVRAARASERAGFHREATLAGWAPTGGHDVVAHDLWVLDRDDLGPGGLTTAGLRMIDPDAPAVDVTVLTRPTRHTAVVPRRVEDAVAIARFDLGRVRARVRRMTPPPVPARLDIADTALRLRRRRSVATTLPPVRTPFLDDLCTPIRPGAWFDTDDADIVYDMFDARRPVGRISLVGVSRTQGFAELAVSLDRAARSVSDRAVGHAVREILVHARQSLAVHRISTVVEPSDVRAARMAEAAGLRHETSLDGAACGRPAGVVEVWGVSPRSAGVTP